MKTTKKITILLATLSLFLFMGCYSDNSLDVWNSAPGEISFHFNGKRHKLAPNDHLKLEGKDVPAGSYTYSTVYTSGVAADVSVGDGCAGEIDFSQRDVHATLEYLIEVKPSTDTTKLDKHTLVGVLTTSSNSSVPDGGGSSLHFS